MPDLHKECALKLHHLLSVREVVARRLNLSRAAEVLNTSQSGITRHLQQLEQELGVALFVRNGKRLTDLTPAGRALLPIVGRVLDGIGDMHRVARDMAAGIQDHVTIATHDTHARYVLPPLIERFLRDFPAVRLRLRQGSRAQVADWVRVGEADFSLAARPREPGPGLIFLPCYEVHRLVLARPDHPLSQLSSDVALEDIARHPLITYDSTAEAWTGILQPFEMRGLPVNVVLSAIDAELLKTYVRSGLGVGIVADIAYDRAEDRDLRAIDARHLFPSTTVHVGFRRGDPPGFYARHLIGLLGPEVRLALDEAAPPAPRP